MPEMSSQAPVSILDDPLYAQALRHMQDGDWAQASKALAALERLYPGAAELTGLQQLLALRLSSERSWAASSRRSLASLLELPMIRALAIAGLSVLLGALWLLTRIAAQIR